jgi:hypothetical protein
VHTAFRVDHSLIAAVSAPGTIGRVVSRLQLVVAAASEQAVRSAAAIEIQHGDERGTHVSP